MPSHSSAQPRGPLIELVVTLLIPSLILMKLSGPEHLGTANALLTALAFPLGWGVWEYLRARKLNFFAALGFVSVLLTGGIGLLQLDPKWLAVKEAAIPALIGMAVLVSLRTRYPLIKTLLYNPAILDVDRVQAALVARGSEADFERRMSNATLMLSATFFFSAAMNYFLATWIVTSPAGSAAFNQELGQLTLLSYPVIALPSTVMMMLILYYLARVIRQLTGLRLTEVLNGAQR